ncbi:MAG: Pyruvate formate-lyase 1-activating enzyme [Candidatus Heimdallarchaeota archaeon LC_3]|nr:MAG: Pyruvate formate-lyase 1-activating enzyme [Candidatus Heimdallarchaeota archaeon LC_3]
MSNNLKETIEDLTQEGVLYKTLPDKKDFIECFACAHRCKIKLGSSGICKVRYNKNNQLFVPWGYVAAWQCDPIEKKPFYHAYPGSLAMSFGMLGCDFHCGFCQNWLTSQTLRNPSAGVSPRIISSDDFIDKAIQYNARVVTSTYNEPLITSEWAVEIFKKAKNNNFATSYVSNGNATPEVLDYIRPFTDLYKIDLKSFQDKNYRSMGGTLEAVLRSIKDVYKRGMWLEIVTLIIPGFNDSDEELAEIASFIANISIDIPWHVTGFHKDYKMIDPEDTPSETLIKAVEIGRENGLNYVYPGNRPGMVGDYENTYCPNCQQLLVMRHGHSIKKYKITNDSKCFACSTKIAGVWESPKGRIRDFPIPI